jgi:hypothetical protein
LMKNYLQTPLSPQPYSQIEPCVFYIAYISPQTIL